MLKLFESGKVVTGILKSTRRKEATFIGEIENSRKGYNHGDVVD